jgi:hypothetical protein
MSMYLRLLYYLYRFFRAEYDSKLKNLLATGLLSSIVLALYIKCMIRINYNCKDFQKVRHVFPGGSGKWLLCCRWLEMVVMMMPNTQPTQG